MTRVNDALAQARARRDSADAPAAHDAGPGFRLVPLDAIAELWPTEGSPASAQPPEHDSHFGLEETLPKGGRVSRLEPPAAVPDVRLAQAGAASDSGQKLVTTGGLEPGAVEQYRRLAARLYLAQAERGTRVVMVTSPLVGEGKTLTAANVALTLSESYRKRVLLIDADLRHPWVHELFGVPNVTGLNDGIRANTERKVPLIRLTENLSLLTAGRPDPDPMSVLSSDRMKRVLEDASAAFDWVIIDTPPVALLSDAHLLASLVDTVILVIRAGVTPLQAIKTAADAVGRDRILGVVVNCVDGGKLANHYGSYATRGHEAVEDAG